MRGGERWAPFTESSSEIDRSKRPLTGRELSYTRKKRTFFFAETKTLSLVHSKAEKSRSFRLPHCSQHTEKKHWDRRRRRKIGDIDGYRKWVYSPRDISNYNDKVVVVSYNILGVENASKHSDLYLKVPPKFLDWDRRKKLISKEINHYHAGIVCLQEVDRFEDLSVLLQKDGFRGLYKARTGEAGDGCAIFWKEKKFVLLHQENIEFQEFGLRNNVAQFCVLQMNEKESNAELNIQASKFPRTRSILVGNIHVLFNPNRGDIKLGQVRLFLERAHQLSQAWGSIPVVLSGDLNSLPHSAIYQFLSSSKLDTQLHDRRKISGQVQSLSRDFKCPDAASWPLKWKGNIHEGISQVLVNKRKLLTMRDKVQRLKHLLRWTAEELTFATGNLEVTCLQHSLKLSSAYRGVPGSSAVRDKYGEPLATSFHSKFMGTVDYIWHSEELVPVRALETLPIDILRTTGGLPSKKWGSDHLALVCELAFI